MRKIFRSKNFTPDSLARIEKHGDSSWEVDALPPDVLSKLIEMEFESMIDPDVLAEITKREETDKNRLRDAVAEIMGDDTA